MIKHYIIMSSSYKDGGRIALDLMDDMSFDSQMIEHVIGEIRNNCGEDVPLSTHFIETTECSWDSVQKYDSFFENVVHIESVSDFIEKIKESRILSGLDVATYILTKVPCTHLSLEKLVYFAYADYLCEYSEPLFKDTIYAFQHGPVIESVYETFKRSGYDTITLKEDEENGIHTQVREMPAKSRILFAKDGYRKLASIDATIEKYGKCSASTLVRLTHRKDSPWKHVDSMRYYQIISDDLIKQYHYIESI